MICDISKLVEGKCKEKSFEIPEIFEILKTSWIFEISKSLIFLEDVKQEKPLVS